MTTPTYRTQHPLQLGRASLGLALAAALGLGAGIVGLAGVSFADTDTPPPEKKAQESLFPAIDPNASVAQLEDQLEEVGPTKEQRLAAIEVDDEAMEAMRKTAKTWKTHNLGTNSIAVRTVAREELVKERGLKAMPFLMECLESDAYWPKREAIRACVDLVDTYGDEARWLLYHHDVPKIMIEMIGTGPESNRADLREDVEDSLIEIVGRDPLLVHELSGRTWWTAEQNRQREAFVTRIWSETWSRIQERWTKVQQERAAYRARLEAAITAAKATERE